jgi:acyl carrier protein
MRRSQDSDMVNIQQEIREFIIANFLFGQDGAALDDTKSFLESGIIDSTGVLELVAFLEQHFGITVADRELLPENLDSVANATRFVTQKQQSAEAKIAG